MPYTNIIWIKLFLSLINKDDRFLYHLNESQQLLYIKMLLLAGITENKIPRKIRFICDKIGYHHDEECFTKDIARIMEVFPKLKKNENYFYFLNFDKLHNQVRTSTWNKGIAQGLAQGLCKNRIDKNRIDKAGVNPSTNKVFYDAFQTKFGKPYVASFGKDGAIFKELGKIIPEEELVVLINRYFASEDKFIKDAGYTVGVFKSVINRLRAQKEEVRRQL